MADAMEKRSEVLRNQLKVWESSFLIENGRRPSREDIASRPRMCECRRVGADDAVRHAVRHAVCHAVCHAVLMLRSRPLQGVCKD